MFSRKPKRGSHAPGTFFYYNNRDFNALGTMFERVTSKGTFTEFDTEIANPIGMQDFDLGDAEYRFELERAVHSQYRFRMSTRDLARFGLLFQQEGVWDGKRIFSDEWIEASTTSYCETRWGQYGYLWKTFSSSISRRYGFTNLSDYDFYYISGLCIHVLADIPELGLVFVHRVDTDRGIPNYTSLPFSGVLDPILAARVDGPSKDARLTPLLSTLPPSELWGPKYEPLDVDLESLDSYAGEYEWNGTLITIELRGGGLVFLEDVDRMYVADLMPESISSFRVSNSDHRKIEFARGPSGTVALARIIEEGVVMPAPSVRDAPR